MRRWNAFFVVIPVRGNKYYIPPNGIDLYEPWKFWGVRITKNFWCVCDDKNHFSCVFLFPKKQRFLTSFFMQIRSGNPNFFQFTFALTCVPKMVCAWLHTKSEMLRSKIWDGFEKIPYRTKFMLLPWPETPPSHARAATRSRTNRGGGAIGWQSHRSPMPLWNFRNGLRRLGPCCGASVGTTGSAPCALRCRPWSVVRGLCWNHWFRPLCACVPVLSQKCANAAAGQHATREQWIRFMGFALRESLRPWSIANWQNSIFSRLRCIDVQKLEKYDEKLQKMYGFLAFSSYRCPRIPIFLVFGITTQNLCKTRPYLVIPVRKMGCFF